MAVSDRGPRCSAIGYKDRAKPGGGGKVRLHILRKNLARKPAGMPGVFPDYGDLLGRDQDRLEGLYVQGYGAFFFTEVDLIRSAPVEKKADEGQTGSTPADPVWDQARREMGTGPRTDRMLMPGVRQDQGWEPDDLVKELIQTFRHASNIRYLDPNEMITLSVIGRTPMPLPGGRDQMAYGGMGMVPEVMGQTEVVRGFKETTFTLQARKADIDQFAHGQISLDQFRQKVKVLTY